MRHVSPLKQTGSFNRAKVLVKTFGFEGKGGTAYL